MPEDEEVPVNLCPVCDAPMIVDDGAGGFRCINEHEEVEEEGD
jgi:hypothetical protein